MKKVGKRTNIRVSWEAYQKIIKIGEKRRWSVISVIDELLKNA